MRLDLLFYQVILVLGILANCIPPVFGAGSLGLMHQSVQFMSVAATILGALRPKSSAERHLEHVKTIKTMNRILVELAARRPDAQNPRAWMARQNELLSAQEAQAVEAALQQSEEELAITIDILGVNIQRSTMELQATSNALIGEVFLRAAIMISTSAFLFAVLMACGTRLLGSRRGMTQQYRKANALLYGTEDPRGISEEYRQERLLMQLSPEYAGTVAYFINQEELLSSEKGSTHAAETQEDVLLFGSTGAFMQAGAGVFGALSSAGTNGLSAAIAVSKPFTIAASASMLSLGYLYMSDTIYRGLQELYSCLVYSYLLGNVILPTLGFVMIGVILLNGIYVFWQSFTNRLIWVPIRIVMTFSFVALVTFAPLLGQVGAGFSVAALQFTQQGMTTSLFPIGLALQPAATFLMEMYLFAFEGSCAILQYITGGIGRAIGSPVLVNATDAAFNIPLNALQIGLLQPIISHPPVVETQNDLEMAALGGLGSWLNEILIDYSGIWFDPTIPAKVNGTIPTPDTAQAYWIRFLQSTWTAGVGYFITLFPFIGLPPVMWLELYRLAYYAPEWATSPTGINFLDFNMTRSNAIATIEAVSTVLDVIPQCSIPGDKQFGPQQNIKYSGLVAGFGRAFVDLVWLLWQILSGEIWTMSWLGLDQFLIYTDALYASNDPILMDFQYNVHRMGTVAGCTIAYLSPDSGRFVVAATDIIFYWLLNLPLATVTQAAIAVRSNDPTKFDSLDQGPNSTLAQFDAELDQLKFVASFIYSFDNANSLICNGRIGATCGFGKSAELGVEFFTTAASVVAHAFVNAFRATVNLITTGQLGQLQPLDFVRLEATAYGAPSYFLVGVVNIIPVDLPCFQGSTADNANGGICRARPYLQMPNPQNPNVCAATFVARVGYWPGILVELGVQIVIFGEQFVYAIENNGVGIEEAFTMIIQNLGVIADTKVLGPLCPAGHFGDCWIDAILPGFGKVLSPFVCLINAFLSNVIKAINEFVIGLVKIFFYLVLLIIGGPTNDFFGKLFQILKMALDLFVLTLDKLFQFFLGLLVGAVRAILDFFCTIAGIFSQSAAQSCRDLINSFLPQSYGNIDPDYNDNFTKGKRGVDEEDDPNGTTPRHMNWFQEAYKAFKKKDYVQKGGDPYNALRDLFQKGNSPGRRAVFYTQATEYMATAVDAWVRPMLTFDGLLPERMLDETKVYVQIPTDKGLSERPLILLKALGFVENVTIVNPDRVRCEDENATRCKPDPEIKVTMRDVDPEQLPRHFYTHLHWTRGTECGEFFFHAKDTKTADLGSADYALMVRCVQDTLKALLPAFVSPYLNFLPADFFTNDASKIELLGVVVNHGSVMAQYLSDTSVSPVKALSPGYRQYWAGLGLNVSHYEEWCDAFSPVPFNMTHNATLLRSVPEIAWSDWIDHRANLTLSWYQKRNQGILLGNFGSRKGRMRVSSLDRGANRTDADGNPVEDEGVDMITGLQMSMLLGWDYSMAAIAEQRKSSIQSLQERQRLAGNIDRATNQTVDDSGAILAGGDHPLLVVLDPPGGNGTRTRQPTVREAIYYTRGLESLKNHDHAQVVNNFAVALDHVFLIGTDLFKEWSTMTGGFGLGYGNDTTYFDHILKADNYRGEEYSDMPIRKYRTKLGQTPEPHKKRFMETEPLTTVREVCEGDDFTACEAEQLSVLESHRLEKAIYSNYVYRPSKAWCSSGICEDGSVFAPIRVPWSMAKKRAAPQTPEEIREEQFRLFEQHRLEEAQRWNETSKRLALGWRSFVGDTWTRIKDSIWRGYAKAADRFLIINGFGVPQENTVPLRDTRKRSAGSEEGEHLTPGLANRTATARIIVASVAAASAYMELNTTYRAHLCQERNANMSEAKRDILCNTRNWRHALNAFLDDPDELNEEDSADYQLWLRLFNETAETVSRSWKELTGAQGKAVEVRQFAQASTQGMYNIATGMWEHAAYGIGGEKLDKHLDVWLSQWQDARAGLEPYKAPDASKEKPHPPPKGAYGHFKRPYTHQTLEELRRQQSQWRDEFARVNTNGTHTGDSMLKRMGELFHEDIKESWQPNSRLHKFWEEMKSNEPEKTRLVGPELPPRKTESGDIMDLPMQVYRAGARAVRSAQLESEDRMTYWNMYSRPVTDLHGTQAQREVQYSVNRMKITSPLFRKKLFAETLGVDVDKVHEKDVPKRMTLTLYKEAVLVQKQSAFATSAHAADVWGGMTAQGGSFGTHDSTLHPYGFFDNRNSSVSHSIVKRGVVIDAGLVDLRYYASAFASALKLADTAVRTVITTDSLAPLRVMTWDTDPEAHRSTLGGRSEHVKRDAGLAGVERGTYIRDLIRLDFEHPEDTRYAQVAMATRAGNAHVAPFRENMIRTQFFILPTDDQDALNFAHRIIGCASNNAQLCEQCQALDILFATESAVFNNLVSYTTNYMGPAILDVSQTVIYLTTYNATARIGTGSYGPRFPARGTPVGYWFRAIQQEMGPGFQPPQYGFWQRFFMDAFDVSLPTEIIYNGTLNQEYQAYLQARALYPSTPINWGWEIVDRLSTIAQVNLPALIDTVFWFITQNQGSAATFIHNSVVCNYTTNLNCSRQIAGFFTGFLELFVWYVVLIAAAYLLSGGSETLTAAAVVGGLGVLMSAHMIVVYGNSVFCGLAPLCYWKDWFDVIVYTIVPKCLPLIGMGVMDTNYNSNNCMACSTGFGALLLNSTTANPAAQTYINCFQYGYINAADGFTTIRWYWQYYKLDYPFIIDILEWYSNALWNYGANLVGTVSPSVAETVIRPQANSRWATQAVQQNWQESDAAYSNLAGCSVGTIGFGVSTATVGALVAAVSAYSLLNLVWTLIPVALTFFGAILGYMWAATQNSMMRMQLILVRHILHSQLRFDRLESTVFGSIKTVASGKALSRR